MILDGRTIRDQILENIKNNSINYTITLAIIVIGNNESNRIYANEKIKYCNKIGFNYEIYDFEDMTDTNLENLIKMLNNDPKINGILLQSPIPSHLNFNYFCNLIDSKKDIDGLSINSIYNNYINKPTFLPCSVKGIITLFEKYNIDIKGKNIVIVGKSYIVGKPLYIYLSNNGATTTICDSNTKNLKDICLTKDIIISCCGVPHIIKEDYVKNQAIVIDVGINKIDGKIIGDVDHEKIKNKCSYISPVPGGVGPMTIAMIFSNTYDAYILQHKSN